MNRVRTRSRIIKKVRFAACEVEIAKNCYLKNFVNAVCRIFLTKHILFPRASYVSLNATRIISTSLMPKKGAMIPPTP